MKNVIKWIVGAIAILSLMGLTWGLVFGWFPGHPLSIGFAVIVFGLISLACFVDTTPKEDKLKDENSSHK